MKKILFSLSLMGTLHSCNSNHKAIDDNSFRAIIADSIQVQLLDNLMLFDFDSQRGEYLTKIHSENTFIFFDKSGKITTQIDLDSDGPNQINWPMGIGFLDSKLTIMENQKGILQFSDQGEIDRKIDLVSDYFHFNSLPFSAKYIGNEIVYSRPERTPLDWDNMGSVMEKVYQSPLLEVLNPESKTTRNTMDFPPNSVYSQGKYFHWIFPKIIRKGNEWYLTLLAEMKFHVYEETNGGIEFRKTVDLPVEDAIPMPGVPLNQFDQWGEKHSQTVFGKIEQIYRRKKDLVIIYSKGASNEFSKNYNPENMEEWAAFIIGLPRYAAIFDTTHQLIQKDIVLPKDILFSQTLNDENQIVAKKNQDAFNQEEDFNTFYLIDIERIVEY